VGEVRTAAAQQLTFHPPRGFELAAGARNGLEIADGGPARRDPAVPLTAGEGARWSISRALPVALPNGEDLAVRSSLGAGGAGSKMRPTCSGGRAYTLADETRAGAVAAPPSATAPNVAERLRHGGDLERT